MTYEREGGGGQSVGGSIRARETRRLFQSVAAQLDSWTDDIARCNRLFASGTVRCWNELYACRKPSVPVARRDERWVRAGVGVRRPKFTDLSRVYSVLSIGQVLIYKHN